MSFTRFHDDPNRIQKTNLETNAINDYIFNIPGNTNDQNHYFQDPHIRMQTNGTTLYKQMIQVETELRGMERVLCRDHKLKNNYKNYEPIYRKIAPTSIDKTITKESRASHPAWVYRTRSQYRPDHLFEDPQKHVEIPFHSQLDTNILEKDYYNIKHYKKI